MHTEALKHLRAGTISPAERRYLRLACRTRYYNRLRDAVVSGGADPSGPWPTDLAAFTLPAGLSADAAGNITLAASNVQYNMLVPFDKAVLSGSITIEAVTQPDFVIVAKALYIPRSALTGDHTYDALIALADMGEVDGEDISDAAPALSLSQGLRNLNDEAGGFFVGGVGPASQLVAASGPASIILAVTDTDSTLTVNGGALTTPHSGPFPFPDGVWVFAVQLLAFADHALTGSQITSLVVDGTPA